MNYFLLLSNLFCKDTTSHTPLSIPLISFNIHFALFHTHLHFYPFYSLFSIHYSLSAPSGEEHRCVGDTSVCGLGETGLWEPFSRAMSLSAHLHECRCTLPAKRRAKPHTKVLKTPRCEASSRPNPVTNPFSLISSLGEARSCHHHTRPSILLFISCPPLIVGTLCITHPLSSILCLPRPLLGDEHRRVGDTSV